MVSLWAWAFGGVLSKFFHLGLTRRTIFDEAPSLLLLSTGLFAGSFAGAGYVLQDIAGNRMELLQKRREAIEAQEGGKALTTPPFLRIPNPNAKE